MTEVNEILNNGPIYYINNLDEAIKAKKIGAYAVYLKRSNILDIKLIMKIKKNINIKLIVQCKINNILEVKVLNHIGVDLIHESYCIEKNQKDQEEEEYLMKLDMKGKFINDAYDLGSVLRRVQEGSSFLMMDPKEIPKINKIINEFNKYMNVNSMIKFSKTENVSLEIIQYCSKLNKIPVPVIGNTIVDNIFDIISLKKGDCDNFIIESNILNDDEENLIKLKDILKNNINDVASILSYYNIEQEINLSDILLKKSSKDKTSIRSKDKTSVHSKDKIEVHSEKKLKVITEVKTQEIVENNSEEIAESSSEDKTIYSSVNSLEESEQLDLSN